MKFRKIDEWEDHTILPRDDLCHRTASQVYRVQN